MVLHGGGGRRGHSRAREILDFLADNANSALVRSIEFQNAALHHFRSANLLAPKTKQYRELYLPVEFLGKCQNRGCLACSRRSIEQHMR